ncbi:MAG: DUF4878 domain-containing protein [Chitinophagaceae bacterium]|nr:DUF4878 domain-containing protein [Chitinophagaceae bacterium]
MKKIFLYIVPFITAFAVMSCKNKKVNSDDPKAVLAAFFDKLSKKDIDGAAEYCTKESKSTLDLMKKALTLAESMKDAFKDSLKKDDFAENFTGLEYGNPKIEGNTATVPVTNKKENETIDFVLKKQDNQWKVDFTMATLTKMEKDKEKQLPMPPAGDSTAAKEMDKILSEDSLNEAMKKMEEMLKNVDPKELEKLKDLMKEKQ